MSYDHWKITNPDDEFLGPPPEPEARNFELRSRNLRTAYRACGGHAWFQFCYARQALKDGDWDEYIVKRNSAWWWLARAKDTRDMWFAALLEHGMEEEEA